jgi:hypothetical protein
MYQAIDDGLRSDETAILRISGESPPLVQDVVHLFSDLDFAYASISYFLRMSSGRVLVNIRDRSLIYRFILPPQELFLRTERLRFYSANFSSPGFWEFLGKLNVIEVIRLAINDYRDHQIRKDMQPHEHRKRELENVILENEAIKGRIEVLKELGLDDEQIRVFVADSILQPSEALLNHKLNGLITHASIRSENLLE